MAAKRDRRAKLTPKEARDLLLKQLVPHWYGSAPLFAAIPAGDKVQLFPLEAAFVEKNWLIVTIDPVDPCAAAVLSYCKEMHRRYEALGIHFLVVLSLRYSALAQRETVENLIARNGIKFPVAVDFDGNLLAAVGCQELPCLVFFNKGRRLFDRAGQKFSSLEAEIQPFVRAEDPGLPLLPPYEPPPGMIITNKLSLDFGSREGLGFPPHGFTFVGEWKREEERLITGNTETKVIFPALKPNVAIIVQSLARLGAPTSAYIQVQGGAVRSTEAGPDLTIIGHDGASRAQIQFAAYYHLLRELKPGAEVSLSFPESQNAPIALYGFRFWD